MLTGLAHEEGGGEVDRPKDQGAAPTSLDASG
jgi:hypothetical protein